MNRSLPLLSMSVLALAGCGDLLLESERTPTSIRLDSTVVTVAEGKAVPLTVTVLDQNGKPFDRVPGWSGPVWSFSDPSRAGVQDGKVVALQPGRTQATVQVGDLTATAVVRVNPRELGLSVAGVHLTQSVQRLDGSVPLVRGRDALLRVFLRGDQPNFYRSEARVHLYSGETLIETLTLRSGADSIPTAPREESLEASWNTLVPGRLVQPGLSLVVEAAPLPGLPLKAGSTLRYPASGAVALDVRALPKFWLRLIPIHQAVHNTVGDVSVLNRGQFLQDLLTMFPIAEHEVDIRSTYTTNTSTSTDQGWSTLLSEIRALRAADGSRRYYYGVVNRASGSRIGGIGYVGYPTALGFDVLPQAGYVLAHELGHNFGRRHAPCGNPAGVDAAFPYADGSIGAYGYDASTSALKDPATEKDVMSYCTPAWISDYTYRAVLDFRTGGDGGSGADRVGEQKEPTLLVWGRIESGKAVLEPAFEITTHPVLPSRPGPYTLEGVDAAGAVIFSLPFRPDALGEPGMEDHRQFAFTIPARVAHPERLAGLRLTGPGVRAERRQGGAAGRPEASSARLRRQAGGRVRLEWSEPGAAMALVRDPRTGEVLSFARGGAVLRTGAPELEVLLSDGVRSTRRRISVQ